MADLTHLDAEGNARMVDVGGKAATQRRAVASGIIRMSPEALAAIRAGDAVMVKGSLGSKMGPIVKALERQFPKQAALEAQS